LPSRISALNAASVSLNGTLPPPVQQIQVQAIRLQSTKACLARRDRTAQRRMLRQHFADQKYLAAAIAERLGDELFCRTIGVHFRRVDDRHPQIDGRAQCGDLVRSLGA
jgi:hypothetical protein